MNLGPTIISHGGIPDLHPDSSAEGYAALPPGVVWQVDLQPPSADGVVYVSHEDPADDAMTLDELVSLADSHGATLMPEFKGGLSDRLWQDEDITDVAGLLCNRSVWMQSFHFDMAGAISAGCDSARILCLRRQLIYIPMAGWTFGSLPGTCDAEGRHWSDIVWLAIFRGISKESMPVFIYGTQSRMHLRAVSTVLEPYGAWSDNAPGMLGLGDPTTKFDLICSIAFLWFGLFGWTIMGCLATPTFTACQRCTKRPGVAGPLVLLHLVVLVLGLVLPSSSMDAVIVGAVTSSLLGVLVFEVMMVAFCIAMCRVKEEETVEKEEDDPFFTL